jgi:hypothetical protein
LVAIVSLLISAFAGGGRGQPGGAGSAPATSAPAGGVVPAAAHDSCATFDQAVARLAAKDNKGFIDGMTAAATSSQAAALANGQWQALVGDFATFATDLAANNAQKVFNDLDSINQLCALARGPRTLNLNGLP